MRIRPTGATLRWGPHVRLLRRARAPLALVAVGVLGLAGGLQEVTFPTATASWGTINGFSLANALTTGSCYFAANFDDTTAVPITSNDVIKVTPTVQYNQ